MTLAAAMIIRNEEELLPGCLDSIKDVVDRIVIVDTGSTDNSVKIAVSYDAEVFHHQWQYDFSLHRNQSFGYADADYILYIDADERLKPESAKKIPYMLDFMNNNDLNFAIMQIESDLADGGMGLHIMPRIFRKGTVSFEGVIWNQPITKGKGYITNLWLEHLGYGLGPDKMASKSRQREDMLRMALDKEPWSALYSQYLIRNLRIQGEWEECGRLADELIAGDTELSRSQEQMVRLDRLMVSMALEENIAPSMAKTLAEQFPENLDVQFYLSAMCILNEDLDGAIDAIKKYLMIRYTIKTVGLHEHVLLDSWGWEALALNNLGVAHWKKGELIDALAAMFLSKSMNGNLQGLNENMRQVVGTLLGEMEKYYPELMKGETGGEGVC